MQYLLKTLALTLIFVFSLSAVATSSDVLADPAGDRSPSAIAVFEIVLSGSFGGSPLAPAGVRMTDGQTMTVSIPAPDGGRLTYTVTVESLKDSVTSRSIDWGARIFLHAMVELQKADGSSQILADPGATLIAPDSLTFSVPESDARRSLEFSIDVIDVQYMQLSPSAQSTFEETGKICEDNPTGSLSSQKCCSLECSDGESTGECCVSLGPATCCNCGDCCDIPGPGGGGSPTPPSFCDLYRNICDGFAPT